MNVQLCASSHDALDRRGSHRPSTRFVDHDLPWRNFLSAEFGDKVAEGSTLIFEGTRISL